MSSLAGRHGSLPNTLARTEMIFTGYGVRDARIKFAVQHDKH